LNARTRLWARAFVLVLLVVVIGLIALPAVAARAQDNIATGVAGRVTDAVTGKPIVGAEVFARSNNGANPYTEYGPAITDSNGEYEIAVPAGTYEVFAGANWYDSVTHTDVVVADAETISVQAVTTQDFALTRYAQPVYRFLNLRTGTYFYSADDAEMANVVAHLGQYFRYETIAYGLYLGSDTVNNMPLYRFYNKRNGAHFWTMNEAEKARLMDGHLGWTYEGIAYYVSASPTWMDDQTPYPTQAVYRYYNPGLNAHFYSVIDNYWVTHKHKTPWNFEGVAFFIDPRWND
jgi:Repeat of unknown function (DUF5648)/Carboxypeptidase regulatory-like domain